MNFREFLILENIDDQLNELELVINVNEGPYGDGTGFKKALATHNITLQMSPNAKVKDISKFLKAKMTDVSTLKIREFKLTDKVPQLILSITMNSNNTKRISIVSLLTTYLHKLGIKDLSVK